MSESKGSPAAAKEATTAPGGAVDPEPPATLGQKIFMIVFGLYVLSLFWLVLSHHWYGVLPTWLDPH